MATSLFQVVIFYLFCRHARGAWNQSQPLWTKITLASDLKHLDCEYLSSYELASSDPFPEICFSTALIRGGDSFDAKPDSSKCYFKKCGSLADIKFSDKYTTGSSYTILANAFEKITRAADDKHLDCDYLGSYELGSGDPFPMTCSSKAIILGGDSFDVKPDLSKCYFKKCGSFDDIKFASQYTTGASYSLFAKQWTHVTLAAHDKHLDCEYLGSYTLSSSDSFPEACYSRAMILGGDSFDAKPDNSKCYMKKCGALADMRYSDKYTTGNSFTILTEGFKQITRAADDMHLDCDYLGSYELVSGDEFPMVCFSKAVILDGDSFDAKPDHSKCYFKKCGAFADIKFANKYTTGSSYTLLTGGWVRITRPEDEKHTDCDYLSSFELSASDPFPETCYSKAFLLGADTFDAKPDASKCYFKKCGTWSDIKFSDKYTTGTSFTLLFPRGDDGEWPPCAPETCIVDLNLYWTAELRGAQLPVDSSASFCDPDTFLDSQGAPCFGGHARRLTYFQEEKARLAARNESTFLFDLGGSAFGSPMFALPGYPIGSIPAQLMNELPYDFCTFSSGDFLTSGFAPHERKELVQSFADRICPILMSNAKFSGLLSPLNDKLEKYRIAQLNGKKVGFAYMFPNMYKYAYSFGPEALELDVKSPTNYLLHERSSNFADIMYTLTRTNLTAFRESFFSYQGDWEMMENVMHDLYRVGTLINVDILDVAVEMKTAHPDIATMILLVGKNEIRDDQIYWMLEHGPFDVIVKTDTYDKRASLHKSQTYGKTRLLVTSSTFMGLGKLRARIDQTGVSLFDFHPDFPLTDEIVANPGVSANSSMFYEPIREMNKMAYGTISSPLVGGHRGKEPSASYSMCYYMDCLHGDVLGAALLWQARNLGHKVDFSVSNLGGVRAPLFGNQSTGEVSIGHCEQTLGFKNMLHVVQASGKSIFEAMSNYIAVEERGFIGAGVRVSFFEPCWDYVNHTSPFYAVDKTPPGSPTELEACKKALGVATTDLKVHVTDIQFQIVDYSQCDVADDYSTCAITGWRRLEKGTTYTFATSEYWAASFVGAKILEGQLVKEPQALCNYIKAQNPLQVDSWQDYVDRGSIQYATAQEGWDNGNRIPSVKYPKVLIAEENCPDGKFLMGGGCQPCPIGTESTSDAARDKCNACLTGRYSDEKGLARCKNCQGGTFQNVTKSSACMKCPAGLYSEVGWPFCSQCSTGFFSPEDGSDACLACPKGKYSDAAGSTACTACPGSKVTEDMYSKSLSDCLCGEGFYLEGDDCHPCKEGMQCVLGSDMGQYYLAKANSFNSSAVLRFPMLQVSYWSDPEDPLSVYTCKNGDICPGGTPGSCAPYSGDRACAVCDEGYYFGGAVCEKCTDIDVSAFIFPILPLAVSFFAITLLYARSFDPPEKWGSWQNGFAAIAFIALNHYQVISMAKSTNVELPKLAQATFDFWGSSNDFISIFRLSCAGYVSTFQQRMILQFCLPCILAAVCMIVKAFSHIVQFLSQLKSMEWDRLFNVFMSLIYAFFLGIVSLSCSLFKCHDNPNGDMTLQSDFSVLCYDGSTWHSMLGLAVAAIFFYCILPACVFAWIIYIAPIRFTSPQFQTKWKFLFVKYRTDVHWWGGIVLLKGFVLNLGLVLLRSPVGQLYWLMLSIAVYDTVMAFVRPWRHAASDVLDHCVHLCAIVVLAMISWFAGDKTEGNEGMALAVTIFSCFPFMMSPILALALWRSDQNFRPPLLDKRLGKMVDYFDEVAKYLDPMAKDEKEAFFFILPNFDQVHVESALKALRAEIHGEDKRRLTGRLVSKPAVDRVSQLSDDDSPVKRKLSQNGIISGRTRLRKSVEGMAGQLTGDTTVGPPSTLRSDGIGSTCLGGELEAESALGVVPRESKLMLNTEGDTVKQVKLEHPDINMSLSKLVINL